ncbi:hypothetical protein Tco_1087834 [Tanacetum coccineum]
MKATMAWRYRACDGFGDEDEDPEEEPQEKEDDMWKRIFRKGRKTKPKRQTWSRNGKVLNEKTKPKSKSTVNIKSKEVNSRRIKLEGQKCLLLKLLL